MFPERRTHDVCACSPKGRHGRRPTKGSLRHFPDEMPPEEDYCCGQIRSLLQTPVFALNDIQSVHWVIVGSLS